MSVTDRIRVVPRTIVGTYLRAGRLPVTVAERVARQQENESWAPAVAYETLQAGVETRIGKLLRDEELAAKGRLREEKVAQLRRAAKLEAVAEGQREVADETFEQRREQAEHKRAAAAQKADQREAELERQAEVRERKVQDKAAKKASNARELKLQQDKAIERRERLAKSEALAKESEALTAAREALDAERTVDVIDDTLEGTKEARKTS
ncbi:MAG: hypothetical protein ACJ735_08295 [Actinomycetes bacterium]